MNPLPRLRANAGKLIAMLVFGVAGFVGWQLWEAWVATRPPAAEAPDLVMSTRTLEPLIALPLTVDLDFRRVALGKQLFQDNRLSKDDSLSCASCHLLDKGGADDQPHSMGMGRQATQVNTPTVFNSGFNFKQFWDGRADSLEHQIDGPVENPMELASAWPDIVAKLRLDENYRRRFFLIYPDGIQAANIKDAIATFERSLITPNSRFDRYLRGETSVLKVSEVEGYKLFKSYGCVACHQGVNVGGNMFARFGVMRDYFKDRGNETRADLGRFNVTGDPLHKHVFKVPSLRNVQLTAPYFHDGSAPTLAQAVTIMGIYQVGVTIPPADVVRIVAFLNALTGEYAP